MPSLSPTPSLDGWGSVVLAELDCPAAEDADVRQVTYVPHPSGLTQVLVLAACNGTGSQGSGLYAYNLGAGGHGTRLAQVLLSNEAANAGAGVSFTATGSQLDMQIYAFSAGPVPRCCPDVWYESRWTWSGAAWAGPVTVAEYPSPLAVTVLARPSPAPVGGQITYTVTFANRSETTIWVVWMDTIPGGTSFVASTSCAVASSATPNDLNCGAVTVGIGNGTRLQPGASTQTSVTIAVRSYSPVITNDVEAAAAWSQGANVNGPFDVYVETSTDVVKG